ncbi:MAG: hypothetical protein K2P80_11955 [Beijerinckiaceae bacterium]|nr:hypothetical protein [Beijerinckiaceae bacterium]
MIVPLTPEATPTPLPRSLPPQDDSGQSDARVNPEPGPHVVSVMRDKSVDPHRNPMFELLVKDDSDLAGLLAYALYKLSKREWLNAFIAAHEREPNGDEMRAFILGEQTARRISSYRRQAEDALAGRAPEPQTQDHRQTERPRMETILQQFARGTGSVALRAPEPAAAAMQKPQSNLRTMGGYLLILLALVGLLALMVNYAKSSFFVQ